MKKVIALGLAVMIALALAGCSEGEPDFRDVRWGMSRSQVIAAETEGTYKEYEYSLAYENIVVMDRYAGLSYDFYADNGGLTGAWYTFRTELTEKDFDVLSEEISNILADYESLNASLTEKYGGPASEEIVWLDESKKEIYTDGSHSIGWAVYAGHARLYTIWETERTQIKHILSGNEKSKFDELNAYYGRDSEKESTIGELVVYYDRSYIEATATDTTTQNTTSKYADGGI